MAYLHHIAIGTARVDELATFYVDAFGAEAFARHHTDEGRLRSVWLDVGGVTLMLEYTEQERTAIDLSVQPGPFLIAFSVAPAERPAAEQRLAGLGAPVETRTDFTSYHRDPDGNRIAVSSWPMPIPPNL